MRGCSAIQTLDNLMGPEPPFPEKENLSKRTAHVDVLKLCNCGYIYAVGKAIYEVKVEGSLSVLSLYLAVIRHRDLEKVKKVNPVNKYVNIKGGEANINFIVPKRSTRSISL